jgi:hypothetical protein
MAAGADNVGLFFGEDVFVAIGSILLIRGFLEQNGIAVEPLQLARWAIPTAIIAFAVHGARLLLLALHDDTQVIWAYPADILAVVDVNASTLRVWAHRGVVARDGARYDIGQVWRARMRVGA